MRVLILFTRESIDNHQAFPDKLKSLLESADESIIVDTATYDQLSYILTSKDTKVLVHATGLDVAEYDIVYLRRIKENIAQAIAVGKYCLARNIPVMDSEIAARPGSMGKLTQYLQFSIAGLPFPDTVYSSSHDLLLDAFSRSGLGFPIIAKSVSGSRGSDNHLVDSQADLEKLLLEYPNVHFLLQRYIQNTADYRVWVCGDQIGPILYRSRSTGHLNNTSQGSDSTLLEDADHLSDAVVRDCIRAAKFLQRDLAGVDVVFENDDLNGPYYFFEVNRAPQIEGTPFESAKAQALAEYMSRRVAEGNKL